jgi:hypothetical protein
VTNVTNEVVEGAEVQLHFPKTTGQETQQQPKQSAPSEHRETRSQSESKS